MTRKEAIKILQHTTNLGDGMIIEDDTNKINEALSMAIKALEQEPKFIAKSDGTIEQIKIITFLPAIMF